MVYRQISQSVWEYVAHLQLKLASSEVEWLGVEKVWNVVCFFFPRNTVDSSLHFSTPSTQWLPLLPVSFKISPATSLSGHFHEVFFRVDGNGFSTVSLQEVAIGTGEIRNRKNQVVTTRQKVGEANLGWYYCGHYMRVRGWLWNKIGTILTA